jgi:hypothetical protein
MGCGRCRGLMVVDHFIDMQDDSGHLWLRGWRCVNCGVVVEPEILIHRGAKRSLVSRLMERWKRPARRTYEAIPIGA